jgi:Signal transduction histidine kinase
LKIKKILQSVLGTMIALMALTTCFSAAYFLTAFIYKKIDYQPPALLDQIINSLLGSFFVGLIVYIRVKWMKSQPKGVFESVIKAMKKIAGGDFNVRLDHNTEDKGPFGELVQGVNNMAQELSQMEQMRQEFISNVSHEIQSPLTSIRGFARTLQNEDLSHAERLHYLGIIEAESIRLSKLSDNLLKMASLDAEIIHFESKFYRLDKQIRDIILASEPQWIDKQIDMDVYLDEIVVVADESLLAEVWLNLIHNSIKYTPEAGKVRIDLHRYGDTIGFKIADTGIGIALEDQEHIFGRFYKADKSRGYSNKGSGLGLAIAQKIVEMHRGTITVQSKLGEGSIFTVILPDK